MQLVVGLNYDRLPIDVTHWPHMWQNILKSDRVPCLSLLSIKTLPHLQNLQILISWRTQQMFPRPSSCFQASPNKICLVY